MNQLTVFFFVHSSGLTSEDQPWLTRVIYSLVFYGVRRVKTNLILTVTRFFFLFLFSFFSFREILTDHNSKSAYRSEGKCFYVSLYINLNIEKAVSSNSLS